MTAHAIITKPERKILFPFVLLHHKVVSLSAKLVREMLRPDEVALFIKNHGTWVWNAPSSRRQEVQRPIVASFVPLHEVCDWRGKIDLSLEGICWVVSVGAIVGSFVDRRRTLGLWIGCDCMETEREMP